MYPTRTEAFRLLDEAMELNPGHWRMHSVVAAECAEKIAALCPAMDSEKAFILGLLHDIGRRFGVTAIAHVIDGYDFLMSLGYDDAARICLTHSFHLKNVGLYIGEIDVSEEQVNRISELLKATEYDDYDRLIQLCDSIAMAEGPTYMEERLADVKKRHGRYPQEKWDKNFELKRYFEEKTGKNLYDIITVHK